MIVLPDGGEKIPFEGFINFCVKKDEEVLRRRRRSPTAGAD